MLYQQSPCARAENFAGQMNTAMEREERLSGEKKRRYTKSDNATFYTLYHDTSLRSCMRKKFFPGVQIWGSMHIFEINYISGGPYISAKLK